MGFEAKSAKMNGNSAAKTGWLYSVLDIFVFLGTAVVSIVVSVYLWIVGRKLRDLQGQVALVTGGGGGLGRLLALRLARLKCIVVLWDINKEGVEESCKLVKALGGRCHSYVVDLAKREEVYKAADEVRKDCGPVTLLINNAGLVTGKAFLDTPDHLIQRTFDVNILAHFWTTKAFLPEMLKMDQGHIVTIASLAGHVGVPKLIDYCSSKSAAVGFDEALRSELQAMGVKGVHTTAICPFFIQNTGMFEDVHARYLSPLNLNEVADRIIVAIRGNEKFAIIPGYLQFLLALKWIFPWDCVYNLLQRLVPDAVPEHGSPPVITKAESIPEISNVSNKKVDSQVPFHRSSALEREP